MKTPRPGGRCPRSGGHEPERRPSRPIEGACGSEFLRGQMVQAAVRPLRVAVDPPVIDDLPRLVDGLEPVPVQAFLPEAPVEAFDVRVLCRFVWIDEAEPHAMIARPLSSPGYAAPGRCRPPACPDDTPARGRPGPASPRRALPARRSPPRWRGTRGCSRP